MEAEHKVPDTQVEAAEVMDPGYFEVQRRSKEVIAAEINAIKTHTCGMVAQSALEIGKRLCEAKETIPHGEWSDWLRVGVAYSESTAQRLMRAYSEFGDSDALPEGEDVNIFEGLTFSQMVALFPLPQGRRVELVKEKAVQNLSTRELKDLVEREKRAAEQARLEKENADRYRAMADEALKAKKLTEARVGEIETDKRKMVSEMNVLKSDNEKMADEISELRIKMGKMKVPKERDPSPETLEELRRNVATEYAVKADPDVQGINFNIGDLSERVAKIDEQLDRVAARDEELGTMLCGKVQMALRQIFGAVKWNPWEEAKNEDTGS